MSTDPPYYDNIGYGDLDDFFYVWLRRSLVKQYPSLFATVLDAKDAGTDCLGGSGSKETEGSSERSFRKVLAKHFLECGDFRIRMFLSQSFTHSNRQETAKREIGRGRAHWEYHVSQPDGRRCLRASFVSGFSIHGTWPIRTEAVNALEKDVQRPCLLNRPCLPPTSCRDAAGDEKGVHKWPATRVTRSTAESSARQHRPGRFGSSVPSALGWLCLLDTRGLWRLMAHQ